MGRFAEDYAELEVYREARSVARLVFSLTKKTPREELYSLTDQLRRSSRSVGAQIAEAWSKRRYTKHFVAKLTDADAELRETKHWVDVAIDCGYFSQTEAEGLRRQLDSIGRMLISMITKAKRFHLT